MGGPLFPENFRKFWHNGRHPLSVLYFHTVRYTAQVTILKKNFRVFSSLYKEHFVSLKRDPLGQK